MPLVERKNFVVAEPNVYVIAHTVVRGQGLSDFLRDEGFPGWRTDAPTPAELLVEACGRVCYMSFAGGRGHRDYVENLKESRHGSVLEHASLTFLVTGVSRAFTHECVRHRSGWSYSQLSQRYVDESHAQVVCPKLVADCRDDAAWHHVYTRWVAGCSAAKMAYADLCNELELKLLAGADGDGKLATYARKAVRGAARSVLPNAVETKIAATCNARSLRHFLEMRASEAADSEIRTVAMKMYRAALPLMPDLLGDYEVRTDAQGDEYLFTPYVKV